MQPVSGIRHPRVLEAFLVLLAVLVVWGLYAKHGSGPAVCAGLVCVFYAGVYLVGAHSPFRERTSLLEEAPAAAQNGQLQPEEAALAPSP